MGTAQFYTGFGTRALQYEYSHVAGTDTVDGVKCVRGISLYWTGQKRIYRCNEWLGVDGNVNCQKRYRGNTVNGVKIDSDSA